MTEQNENDIRFSVLGAALTALIRALHENKVIDQKLVLKSMEAAAISAGLAGKEEHSLLMADYIKALRTAFDQK